MHLYKSFFRLLRRNPIGIIIYAAIFVAMIVLLFVIARVDSSSNSEFKNSNSISYIDNDDSELSKGLIRYLSINNDVTDYSDKTESAILDLTFFGISQYHMTIDKGFAEAVMNGDDSRISYITDFDMSGVVFSINGDINNFINTYREYKILGKTDAEAASSAVELLSDQTPVNVVTDDTKAKATGDELVVSQINQFFCYLAFGFLALGVGHTIIANNEVKVVKRIDSSPVPRKKISIANTAGLVTSGVVIWLVFVIINVLFGSGTQIFREYWWVILINSFLTMLVCCALTSVVTSFNISNNSLSMITNIISLSMSFVCGVFVPQWLLGDGVLSIAKFLPFYWSVYANNMTFASSNVKFDMQQLIVCFGMELLFATVFALAAVFIRSTRVSSKV